MPSSLHCRIMLISASRTSRQAHQSSSHCTWQCALICFVFNEVDEPDDMLVLFDLLDNVLACVFDVVILVPLASTWSSAQHSDFDGQRPLRTRSRPLELDGSSPSASSGINTENLRCELVAWFAEQESLGSQCRVALPVVFLEDFGGHSSTGPESYCSMREVRLLEHLNDAFCISGECGPTMLSRRPHQPRGGGVKEIADLCHTIQKGPLSRTLKAPAKRKYNI